MTRHEARQELETVGEPDAQALHDDVGHVERRRTQQRIRVEQLTKEFNAIAAEERGGDEQVQDVQRGDVLSGLQGVTKKLAEAASAQVETELRANDRAEVDQRLGEYDGDPLCSDFQAA